MDKWLDGELYVTLAHSMEKEHFASFAALISVDRVQLVKLYPEQEPAVRFAGVRPAGGLLRMRRLPSGRLFSRRRLLPHTLAGRGGVRNGIL